MASPTESESEQEPENVIRLPPRESGSYDCQDIPESGECRDGVAFYCDRRTSNIVEKRCSARGLTCDDSNGVAICVDGDGNEENVPSEGTTSQGGDTGEPCGDIDNDGLCEGDTVKYCQGGTLWQFECGVDLVDTTCGQAPGRSWYFCLPNNCPDELMFDDGCDENGNLLKCERDPDTDLYGVTTTDCVAAELVCSIDLFGDGTCVQGETTTAPDPADYDCAALGIEGQCVGDDYLVYCADPTDGVQVVSCIEFGAACGGPDVDGWYGCGYN